MEKAQLADWEQSFDMKYDVVGRLVHSHETSARTSLSEPAPSPTLSTNWEFVDTPSQAQSDAEGNSLTQQ
jgi:hypothetical protein